MRVLVVADDLTGANSAAAGFARVGLRAVTIGVGRIAEFAGRFDVVVVSTGGRHCPAEEAARRVADVVRDGWPVDLVANRIDSTLRGNVGASTAGLLRAVRELSRQRVIALCAPAHPGAGRVTVEGHQLLDGVRLEETELAVDPRAPVHTSSVADRLAAQADLRVAHLPLSAVTGEPTALVELVRAHLDVDVLIADALTAGHLDRTARAVVAAAGADVRVVGVDPGPGSVALAAAIGARQDGYPILAVSGSATRLTRVQLARLVDELPVTTVSTVDELDHALRTAGAGDVVLLAPGGVARDVDLARMVRQVLAHHPIDGLFATGGDVSAALFAALGADGLAVDGEIVPLAVAGTFVGGPWAGLPVVTKGGLVGDAGTTVTCVEHLRRTAAARRKP